MLLYERRTLGVEDVVALFTIQGTICSIIARRAFWTTPPVRWPALTVLHRVRAHVSGSMCISDGKRCRLYLA